MNQLPTISLRELKFLTPLKPNWKILLVGILFSLAPTMLKAAPTMQMSPDACYYQDAITHDYWVKVSVERYWWLYVHNMLISADFTFTVTGTGGTVGPVIPPLGSSSQYLINMGSIAPPYTVSSQTNIYYSGTTTLYQTLPMAPIRVDQGCPQIDNPSYWGDGCWYEETRDGVTSQYLKMEVDASFILYEAVHGYTPELWFYALGGSTLIAGHIVPTTIAGNFITYDVTGYAAFNSGDCFDGVIYSVNGSGTIPPNSGMAWDNDYQICECPNPPCSADFDLYLTPYSSTQAALTFLSNYTGTTKFEKWTVTTGLTSTVYAASASYLLPYGTYTVCHTIVTNAGDTCTTCRTVCCSISPFVPYPGSGGEGCNAGFIVTMNPMGGTIDMDFFSNTPTPAGGSDIYTVSNGASTFYTGPGNVSVLVPYGSYRVCLTRAMPDLSTCTFCQDVCLSESTNTLGGKQSLGVSKSNIEYGASIYPNPASDKATIEVSMPKSTENLDIVISDAVGHIVQRLSSQKANQGINHYEISTSALANGLYNVRIALPNQTINRTLTVVK